MYRIMLLVPFLLCLLSFIGPNFGHPSGSGTTEVSLMPSTPTISLSTSRDETRISKTGSTKTEDGGVASESDSDHGSTTSAASIETVLTTPSQTNPDSSNDSSTPSANSESRSARVTSRSSITSSTSTTHTDSKSQTISSTSSSTIDTNTTSLTLTSSSPPSSKFIIKTIPLNHTTPTKPPPHTTTTTPTPVSHDPEHCQPGSTCAWQLGIALTFGGTFAIAVIYLLTRTYRRHIKTSQREHQHSLNKRIKRREGRHASNGVNGLDGRQVAMNMLDTQSPKGTRDSRVERADELFLPGNGRRVGDLVAHMGIQETRLHADIHGSTRRKPLPVYQDGV